MISLVPADAGKPTVRLGKAAIIEGTCSWENPIYETVKLIRDPKTGKFKQNIYYFAVASVSNRNAISMYALTTLRLEHLLTTHRHDVISGIIKIRFSGRSWS